MYRRRMPATAVLLLILLSSSNRFGSVVDGFSTGAGGCQGGVAAVGGLHLSTTNDRPVDSSSLDTSGIKVLIGGQALTVGSKASISAGVDLNVAILSTQIPFLGFLIRLQSPDGGSRGTIVPFDDTTTQTAEACVAPVLGITHRNNLPKIEVNGTIRFDEPVDGATIDVTIVFTNGQPASIYAYSGFTVNVVESGAVPTVPVATPTLGTTAPVTAPSSTTESPIKDSQSEIPSQAPSDTQEFVVPTITPTKNPISTPTNAKSPTTYTPIRKGTPQPITKISTQPTMLVPDKPSKGTPQPITKISTQPTRVVPDKPSTLGLSTKAPSGNNNVKPHTKPRGPAPHHGKYEVVKKDSSSSSSSKGDGKGGKGMRKSNSKGNNESEKMKMKKEVMYKKKKEKMEKSTADDDHDDHRSKLTKDGTGKGSTRNLLRDVR